LRCSPNNLKQSNHFDAPQLDPQTGVTQNSLPSHAVFKQRGRYSFVRSAPPAPRLAGQSARDRRRLRFNIEPVFSQKAISRPDRRMFAAKMPSLMSGRVALPRSAAISISVPSLDISKG